MNKNGIIEIQKNELSTVYPLMAQLRPQISEEQFINIYDHARRADRYTLYGFYDGDSCRGLIGLRFLYDYVHQFHLYIDDLVVDEMHRSHGVGAKLLKFAEELAAAEGCTGLRLCTGVENKDGMRFYEREKWQSRAVVYKKKL